MRFLAAVTVVAMGACLSAGCGANPAVALPRVWAADDMVQMTDRTKPPTGGPWDAASGTIQLSAAANETVSFQLVVDAPPTGAEGVRLTIGPLTGPGGKKIAPESISLFRMRPVSVTQFPPWHLRLADAPTEKAQFYDLLVPLDPAKDPGVNLGPDERLAVWVDVAVPRTAAGGDYAARVTVASKAGTVSPKVLLKVHDFVLPDIRPVPCLGAFSHETVFRRFPRRAAAGKSDPTAPARLDPADKEVAAALVVIRQLMRLAHDHRLDLFDRDLRPVLKRDSFGAVALAWDDYDAIVRPYLDGTAFEDRIGVSAWAAPVHAGWPDPADYGGPDSEEYRQTFAAVLAQTARHFDALGAGGKLFVWPRTGTAGQAAYDRHAGVARLARAAAPAAPILSEVPPAPPPESLLRPPAGLAGLADLYAPRADMVDPAGAAGLARKGEPLTGVWLRPGCPPYLGSFHLLSSPADVRALPWLAMKYRCAGVFIPEVLNWDDGAGESPEVREGGLFHAAENGGTGTVLPSVRLKRLRRGLQDAAYLWLLRQRQREAVADEMIGTMVRYGGLSAVGDNYLDVRLDGWVRAGHVWPAARAVLGGEILSAINPHRFSQRDLLAQQLAWKNLRREASRIRLEKIAGHIEQSADARFRAIVRADLFNELTTRAEVELCVDSLPKGWQGVEGGRQRVSLPSGGRATVELLAEGDHVPVGPDAKMPLPLVLTGEVGERQALTARVPFLVAGEVNTPIAIDGDLSDWPLRAGNAAGNFVLQGRRNALGEGLARRQTLTFALRDGRNLYLAFRCEEPAVAKIHARAGNAVDYQQLMAFGEDLAEVVLDPGRQAKTAEDLYHIVVKCNGVAVLERGVGNDPPLGRRGPWPAMISVAVGKTDKAWFVEMAIPLEALGSGAEKPLWGANFARYATADDQSSSWAGSARHFYSPADLGTLCLGPLPGPTTTRTSP